MAGSQAPDVFWSPARGINAGQLPAGSYVPLTQYLQRPNKYVPGNTKWLDLFNVGFTQQITSPTGEINVIAADYVATLVMYNKRMFREAGIDFDIKNWSDYTKACELLKAKGFTPWQFPFKSWTGWMTRLWDTNLYMNDFANLAVIGGPDAISISPLETAIGVKNGYFTSKDPRFIGWWPIMKEHVEKYMPRDSVSAIVDSTTTFNSFVNEQIAMYWDGSWADNDLKKARVSFEYASFPFPPPDKATIAAATDYNSSGAVGGPGAAFLYGVSSRGANSTMTDDKLEAVIDWLMYITTPENNELVCNDLGSFVPTIKGAKPSPANAGVASILEVAPKVIMGGSNGELGSDAADGYTNELMAYLQGNQTLQQAGANLDRLMQTGADIIIEQSGQDISRYLKK
jgi:hypothetical protein